MSRRIFFRILLVAVAVLGLFALSGVLLAQGRSGDALDHVMAVQERNTERFMAQQGVVGTAVGLNGSGRHVVLVLLERSGVGSVPEELDGVPVQTVVTGKLYALPKPPGTPGKGPGGGDDDEEPDPEPPVVDPTERCPRPVPIGVSTGHFDITAGTIGCRVTDGTNVYALSNNHVYANCNDASIGDNVLQPGPYDEGVDPDDKIGTLADFEPIDFSGGNNTIDAAIALSSTDDLLRTTPADGYGVPRARTVRARLLMNVKKYGRTTGLTEGYVAGVNATVDVWYDETTVARFVKQTVFGPAGFSDGGDSGSLIVGSGGKDDGKGVGLLFAGSTEWTIANPIRPVLERFDVSIDGK